MIIKGNRRIAGGGRKYSLPLTVVAAVIGTYLVTSNFEAPSAQHNNLRQTATASSNALLGMVVPQGRAVALPSVRISAKESVKIDRKIYGGEGDKAHLGGFTSFDPHGVSPTLWKHMVEWLGVKSLLDVGCGIGTSTAWFVTHGLEFVQCVEGSHDAVTKSLLPKLPQWKKEMIVEHDFSRGPWWPDRTVDVVWSVEFLEHVGRNFQHNYFTAFRKAALIFVTHSNWGGWHHVEVHDEKWWRARMEMMGFIYSEDLTEEMTGKASLDKERTDIIAAMESNGSYSVGQHIWTTLQVYINPLVASLPEHAHLLAEHGCYTNQKGIECGTSGNKVESVLPDRFKPLKLTDDMDKEWSELVKDLKIA